MIELVLADSSVWIEKFRRGGRAAPLDRLLEDDLVVIHPWVVGELSLGNLPGPRKRTLQDLWRLEQVAVVDDVEVMQMVETRRLVGEGIGWVDAQLLASSLVAGVRLWTLDAPLERVAREVRIAWTRER